ncbi:MAG: bifunctional oligoribonuclease/PAP phosphatase NrnA [Spirochaetes bacterium]|nr:bifunctional oligoribonuclease/PAP phosphatase NrnA [Spirochaetota bacterium]
MIKGINNLKEFISKHEKFVLSTHESPDGDAIGSAVAFNEFLHNLGKTSFILNSDPTPDNFKFIDIDNEVIIYSDKYILPDDIDKYAHIVLDTNDYNNIGLVYFKLKDLVIDRFIIDHHESGGLLSDSNFIKIETSSVSEIVFQIYTYYKMKISFKSAQAIFAGMVFDTGSFRYPKTSPDTLKAAAECINCGVVPFFVYEQIWEQNSLAGFKLRSKILSTTETFLDGKMIAMKLTPKMIEETNASFAEGETMINMPLTVKGVVLSVLVKQNIEGPVKVSMRSKGEIDVADIAMKNGGGGHKNAAGYKSNKSFDETYKYVVDILLKLFN